MAEEGHGRSDAHHGFTHKGKDGKESHGLRVEMQHVDLIMLKPRVEEGGERRNQASPKGIDEIGTSVAARAMRVRDVGQATVFPLSLKLEASIGRTLSMASSLSTKDRPTAGSTAGGALGEDMCFFPLSACVRRHGDDAGRGQVRSERRSRVSRKQRDWGSKARAIEE